MTATFFSLNYAQLDEIAESSSPERRTPSEIYGRKEGKNCHPPVTWSEYRLIKEAFPSRVKRGE